MRIVFCIVALFGPLALAGCQKVGEHAAHTSGTESRATELPTTAMDNTEEADIKAARAELSPEDQKTVGAQEYCVIMTKSRLGSMGAPLKVMVKDKEGKEQPVFVCCKGCVKKAQKDPEKILATVEELKAKVKGNVKP